MAQYSKSVVLVWKLAASEAETGSSAEIEPAHLLLGLCKLCDLKLELERVLSVPRKTVAALRREIEAEANTLREMFQRAGLDLTAFRRRLRGLVANTGPSPDVKEGLHRSMASRRVFQRAEAIGTSDPAAKQIIRAAHLLQAILEVPSGPWVELLAEMGVRDPLGQICGVAPPPHVGGYGIGGHAPGHAPRSPRREEGAEAQPQPGAARPTPFLDRFGRDLTRLARDGKLDPVIGRREEMKSLARVLTQKRKSNAILVGEAGVGKTCIVEGLAQRIVSQNPPPALQEKRLVEVSMAALVAGARYRGDFEQRMQGLIQEASAGDDIILFIDEIHTVMGAGGEGSADAANILKPALARGELHCIGATTVGEYRKFIEKDPAFERRFEVVWVSEPGREEALEIVRGVRPKFEEHHGIQITDEAIQAAVELAIRYLPDLRLPDKAIDLIDQACAAVRLRGFSTQKSRSQPRSHRREEVANIGRAEIAAVVAQRCRVPVERLAEDEAKRLLRMEEALCQRVMGQDEAVRAVAEAIRTARAGLKDPRRPVGVFLFAGSTGTGKTELAKALAEFLFGDEPRLIRVDMSEYMEKHAVSRLIGAPPGYIGHDEEGQLTGPVRTNPYSVVLFDEVEKAHPDVMNIFLQIFDDGRLTDARGRHVSFSETVIILTSNLGSVAAAPSRHMGFGADDAKAERETDQREAYRQQIMAVIRQSLRPELFNRIQHVVFFYPLDESVVRRIVDKILDSVRQRLSQRKINIELTAAAYALLMREGFDPQYGAREMERAVDRLIVQPLGKAVLEGRIREGATVRVDARDEQLVLKDTVRTRRIGP